MSTIRFTVAMTLALTASLPVRAGDPTRVPAISAQRLVCASELAIRAKVTDVSGWLTWRKATAQVAATWFGEPHTEVVFRSVPSVFDGRVAQVGDDSLLFLHREPGEEPWSIAAWDRGRFRVTGDAAPRHVVLPVSDIMLPGDTLEPTGRAWESLQKQPRRMPLDEFRDLVLRLHEHHAATVAAAGEELHAMLAADRHALATLRALDASEGSDSAALAARAQFEALRARHAARFAERDSWTRDDCDPMPHLDAEAVTDLFALLRRVDDAGVRRAWCDLLEQAALRDELPRLDVARFIDEARVGVGELQWFGTFYAPPRAPQVIAPVTLDSRRREFGLRPWLEVERERAAAEGGEPVARPRAADG